MTRRTIIFTDADGTKYATPQFNGDKTEFIMFQGSKDVCDADWPEIFAEFDDVKTLKDFEAASKRAQLHYRSFINHVEIECGLLPVWKPNNADIYRGALGSDYVISLNEPEPNCPPNTGCSDCEHRTDCPYVNKYWEDEEDE